jgi:hypothetical protein
MTKEVMKQALEVLKSKDTWGSSIREAKEDVIKALEEALKQEPVSNNYICLTEAEIQSGFTRVQWAEALIKQIPKHHEGRNSWLLNYGRGQE